MPSYTSQSVVYGRTLGDALVGALKTRPAAALITAGKVRLSADPGFNPTPDSVLADLVAEELAFSGYPAGGANCDMSGPVNLGTQAVGMLAGVVFIANNDDPFISGNGTGWWIDDGTNFLAGERFAADANVNFGAPGDYLDLMVAMPVDLLVDSALSG